MTFAFRVVWSDMCNLGQQHSMLFVELNSLSLHWANHNSCSDVWGIIPNVVRSFVFSVSHYHWFLFPKIAHRMMSEFIAYSLAFLELCAKHSGDGADSEVFRETIQLLLGAVPSNL